MSKQSNHANQQSYLGPAWILATLWIGIVTFMVWQAFGSEYRPFVHDKAPDLSAMPKMKTDTVTLVHYLDEQCSCNRFAKTQIEELTAELNKAKHIYASSSAKDISKEDWSRWGISSPSVSIFAPNGSLLYHGPYTSGEICGQGEDLVKKRIAQWEQGDSMPYHNILSSGCFCPWKTTEPAQQAFGKSI